MNSIGRVIRANTRSFVFGTRVPKSDVPVFGSLVRARIQHRDSTVYGLIYDIEVLDDGATKLLSVADRARPEDIAYQRSRRVPVEASVLLVGFAEDGGAVRHGLPAQPPITLDEVYACDAQEVRAFNVRLDYFRLVLDARDTPADELIAAAVRAGAGACVSEAERARFVLECGRELARLLAGDGARLEGVLRRLQA